MGTWVTCPKCKGNNSKHYETCSNCNGRSARKTEEEKKDIRKFCSPCQDTGKSSCYSCDGTGRVYVDNNR